MSQKLADSEVNITNRDVIIYALGSNLYFDLAKVAIMSNIYIVAVTL